MARCTRWADGAVARLVALVALVAAVPAQAQSIPDAARPRPLDTARTIAFTTTEGTWMSLDVSRDGRTILFELLGDLYTIPIGGGEATPLLVGPAFESQPRYSPDGTRIVYISDRSGSDNVWLANADGNAAVQLSRERHASMFSPVWMPDGQSVIVSANAPERDGTVELWRYDVAGGAATKVGQKSRTPSSLLVSSAAPGAYGAQPTSDGRYLYYTMVDPRQYRSTMGATAQLTRLDLATGQEERVTARPQSAFKAVLSPDGALLIYATQLEGTTGLRLRHLDTKEERWLAFPVQRDELEARPTRDVLPNYAFTPDGLSLIVAYGGQLRRIEIGTGATTVIPFSARVSLQTRPMLDVAQRMDTGAVRARILQRPAVSPDGRRLAFSTMAELYLVDLTSGSPRRLTRGVHAREFDPTWSPDGAWVAYVTWTARGGQVWRMRADGSGDPLPVTSVGAYYADLAWSPDGTRLVAIRASRQARLAQGGPLPSDAELVSIPLGGGPVTRVARAMVRPHFGRDPQRVYGTSQGEGLVSVGMDGTDRRVHVQVVGGIGTGAPVDADEIVVHPGGEKALALVASEVYVIDLPPAESTSGRIDVRSAETKAIPLSTIGADAMSWSDQGRGVFWTAGATIYRRPAPGEVGDALPVVLEREMEVEKLRATARGSVVLRGATVITMRGDEVVRDADVLVTDNRIVRVSARNASAAPNGARVVDVSGTYIIPGFIDVHAHWDIRRGVLDTENYSALASLAYGVTAIRDPQSFSPDIFSYSDLTDVGEMIGPRIVSTGRGLFSTDFRSLEHARATLSRYKGKYRTQLIKSYLVGNREQRQWVVEASRQLQLMPTTEGGGDFKLDLTHAMDGFSGNEHALPTAPIFNDVVQLFARSGITYTPTLLVAFGGPFAQYTFFARESVYANAKLRRFYPQDVLYSRATARIMWNDELEYHFPKVAAGAAAIQRAGGRVAVGGHGELHGLGFHWEMWALATGGMRPSEILRSATMNGAEAIGYGRDLGSVERGKLADLVVLDRNPLTNIRNTASIRYVMKNGVLYAGETLDEVWPSRTPLREPWWRGEAVRSTVPRS